MFITPSFKKSLIVEQFQGNHLKVPITPKSFFRSKKSLHLSETHCAFLPPFNPNIDLLQAVKVTKSGYHLSHDRASTEGVWVYSLFDVTNFFACMFTKT